MVRAYECACLLPVPYIFNCDLRKTKYKLWHDRYIFLQNIYQVRIMIDPFLVEILACPKCKGPVKLLPDGSGLVCEKCKLLYEIRDDIPIMLIEEAKPLTSVDM